MQPLKLKPNSNALVIVAHPDDETIWMGGTMLHFPKIKWTIFSLCRRDDVDRQPKFLKACQVYQAQAIISDLEDEGLINLKDSIAEIKERLNKLLTSKKFDYLFTHGAGGEYGHERHLGVHQTVKQLIKEKKLDSRQVFYFCYKTVPRKKIVNNKTAKFRLKLTKKEHQTKQNIAHQLYGFDTHSFEHKSCLDTETFC